VVYILKIKLQQSSSKKTEYTCWDTIDMTESLDSKWIV